MKRDHINQWESHGARDVFVPPHLEHDPLGDTFPPQGDIPQEQAEEPSTPRRVVRHKRRRINPKRQQQLRRRRCRLGAIFVVLAVFAAWLVLRLAPISFGNLVVDGTENMTADDVYHSSGVYSYVNVVQLSPDEIQHRLSEDLRVASVTVTRQFPATIHIRIVERKPAVVIATMYGFAYVDNTGKVMDIQPQIKGVSVPILTGKRVDTLLLGEQLNDLAIHASLKYLQQLSPDVAPLIAEINVGNKDNIIAYTTDSLPIHLGAGDDAAERAAITAELLAQVKDRQLDVQYIDTNVRAPLVKEK